MRTLTFIAFLHLSVALFGQEKKEWYYPQKIKFQTSEGDTSFYAQEDSRTLEVTEKASIWRIRSGDTLNDFYPGGHLQSISLIKEVSTVRYLNAEKIERVLKEFDYDGPCRIYFDDSTKTIAAVGQYKNNNEAGEWKYYDKQGRLTEKSYPMTLWTRSDYYDTTGQLSKQIDRIDGMDKSSVVREAEFINGEEKIISDKSFFAKIFLHFTLLFMIIILGSFFLRIPFNHLLYKREGKGSVSLFWFPGSGTSFSDAFFHQLRVFYTFWWSKVKPENKVLAVISNILSVIALLSFFGTIIGLAISGELK